MAARGRRPREEVGARHRLDRLGRSLKHLIELMAELEAERIGFQSVTESIDTTTPGGKLVFHIIFAALNATAMVHSMHFPLIGDQQFDGRGHQKSRLSVAG